MMHPICRLLLEITLIGKKEASKVDFYYSRLPKPFKPAFLHTISQFTLKRDKIVHWLTGDKQLSELSREWRFAQRYHYARITNLVTVFVIAFMIPLDYLTFEISLANRYVQWRILFVAAGLVNLLLLKIFKNAPSNFAGRIFAFAFLPILVAGNILYLYFLTFTTPANYNDVLIGNLMVVFACSFLLHRFRPINYCSMDSAH